MQTGSMQNLRSLSRFILFGILGMLLLWVMIVYLPPGVDWERYYRPAALGLFTGRDPYLIQGYYNPVWALFPIMPLAWLPSSIGRAGFFLMSLAAFGFAAYRMGARPLASGAFLASPPVLHCLLNGNVDWMPLLGFVLPPQIGLFFVAVKPQMGFTVAIFWFVESWREGGWREVFRTFLPVTLGFLLTLAVFGLWPLHFTERLSIWWNASLWPMSIPAGLVLLTMALRRRKIEYAMGAAPCLSPYILFHSWSGALMAIVSQQLETLIAVIGLWILVLLRALG